MNDAGGNEGAQYDFPISQILRGLLAINFIRFGLSFLPRFEGTELKPGLADRMFGGLRLFGFRSDLVFMVCSTVLIGVLGIGLLTARDRESRIDRLLCAAWIIAFVVYLVRSLFNGLLDFG